jgi:hypothetical protein
MHSILTGHPAVSAAQQEVDAARKQAVEMLERVDEAQAEYERAKKEALNRGEVHSPPLVPVASREVRSHLESRLAGTVAALDQALKAAAHPLLGQLHSREVELIARAARTKVADLGPLASELQDLATAQQVLQVDAARRDYATVGKVPTGVLSGESALAALVTGRSVIVEPVTAKAAPEPTGQVFPGASRRLSDAAVAR